MARVELPIVVLNSSTGLPVNGASVAVKFRSSGLNATWWTQETGGTSSTAAVTTDANGRATAWLDRGAYNCTISGTGITTYTEPWDAAPAADNAIDALWLPDNVIATRHLGDGVVTAAELGAAAVTNTKIGPLAVDNTHLATAAKNLFPQLKNAAARTINFGVTDSANGGSWGLANEITSSIAHGLGVTPSFAWITTDTGNVTGNADDIILASIRTLDATNINIRLATRGGGTANFPGINVYWLVVS